MSLELINIRKNFYQGDSEIRILHGVSATIDSGQIVAVVGQSGSGKSTLLSLLSGLDRLDSGSIVIDGVHLESMKEQQLTQFRARNIGIVFQQYHLISHLTSLENVMLALEILKRDNPQEKALKMLEELGLGHRLHHLPSQLSGGECQRVAIARALVVQPKVLLADEPSGNLDAQTGEKVMDAFFECVRKYRITTIFVTHSHSLAKRCERLFQLEGGRLRES